MPDTNSQQTLDTNASEFRLNRFESAWRTSDSPPDWRQHLPSDEEPCSSDLIFDLLQMDIVYRIKVGLPALLAEHYFAHPRLQKEDARLRAEQQVELIRWEYQQRWDKGETVRRAEYEAAFPQHADAVREMKPQSRCPRCRKVFVLDETYQTRYCPTCDSASPLSNVASHPEFDPRGYQLIEQLGKGGMGEVYRCGDPALGRDLAIKVMRAESCGHAIAERRFLREARVTGSLQHPGIVPVYNLGRLSDGRLHYTMRLVRGDTFADILKNEAGKPERLPDLLGIFEKICQAVAYAHSKRVIHRDLKPHNVMVGKFGEVQVMDWGLAKLLTADDADTESEETVDMAGTRIFTESADTPVDLSRVGVGLGTLPYMPSEQARGKWNLVDERADVFALGSILCEILTGQPAYTGTNFSELRDRAERGDVTEALQRLQECDADTALTGLCRECLSSHRENRPRDSAAVAKRVAEYQAEVQARLRRAEIERAEAQLKAREGRKQRRLLIALVLALLTGAVLSAWQAVRATAERDDKEIALGKAKAATEAERQAKEEEASQRMRAKESEADSKAVLEFFELKILLAGRPADEQGGLGKNVTLREALDKAEPDISDSFKDRPLVEASIRNTLGMTYMHLGEAMLAIQQHQRALAFRETKLGPDHPDTLISRNNLAMAYQFAGRNSEAIPMLEQILKHRETKLGLAHPDTLTSCNNLAAAYQSAGRTAEAIRLLEQVLKQRETNLGLEHSDTLIARNNLAVAYGFAGRAADAIRLLEQILKQRETKLGPENRATLRSRNNLAEAYLSAGRIADAIHLNEQNLKQMENQLGPDHPETLMSRNNLANEYRSAGRTAKAVHMLEQNLKHFEAKLEPDHPDTLSARHNLALAYWSAGRTADAIGLYERTLTQRKTKLGADHPKTLLTMASLGLAYRDDGRLKDAILLLDEVLVRGSKRSGGLPPQCAWVPGTLAGTYERAGQFAKAEAIYRDLLDQARRRFGSEHQRTLGQLDTLGSNLMRQHKYTDAEPLLRDCLRVRAAKQPDDWATFNTRSLLGATLLGQKKCNEAEPLLLQGYEGMKAREAKIPPQGRIYLTEALERLVHLYEAMNKEDEAAKWRKELDARNAAQKKPKS